jgi:hypothetical protein
LTKNNGESINLVVACSMALGYCRRCWLTLLCKPILQGWYNATGYTHLTYTGTVSALITNNGARNMTKWKIIDWAGNRMYPDQVFDTFEDGRYFIDCKVADPEEHQEYYVVEMKLAEVE